MNRLDSIREYQRKNIERQLEKEERKTLEIMSENKRASKRGSRRKKKESGRKNI